MALNVRCTLAQRDRCDLAARVVIGRGPTADVVLESTAVSDEQAMPRQAKAGRETEYLRSLNGWCLSRQRVTGPDVLFHGDDIPFSKQGLRTFGDQLDRDLPARPNRPSR